MSEAKPTPNFLEQERNLTQELQMRRRTFLAGSAAAMLASGSTKGNAQQSHDTTGEFNFIVTLRVYAGKEEEVAAILREMQAATLANEKSCLRYECYRASTPQTYVVLERWTDLSAAQEHLKAPHIVSAVEKLLPLVPGGEIPAAVRIRRL
jgi:quinol monooxygenase YgiN